MFCFTLERRSSSERRADKRQVAVLEVGSVVRGVRVRQQTS
jgi:hypothetical protein